MNSPWGVTLTRGARAPRATLTRTTAETEIDDFCLDRPPRARLLLFLFCLSALKSFRVDDDAEGTQLERRKEGKSATIHSLCPSLAGD